MDTPAIGKRPAVRPIAPGSLSIGLVLTTLSSLSCQKGLEEAEWLYLASIDSIVASLARDITLAYVYLNPIFPHDDRNQFRSDFGLEPEPADTFVGTYITWSYLPRSDSNAFRIVAHTLDGRPLPAFKTGGLLPALEEPPLSQATGSATRPLFSAAETLVLVGATYDRVAYSRGSRTEVVPTDQPELHVDFHAYEVWVVDLSTSRILAFRGFSPDRPETYNGIEGKTYQELPDTALHRWLASLQDGG